MPEPNAKRPHIKVYVNNRPIEFTKSDRTGREIKHRAEVPEDFMLYGPDGEPIGDHEHVELHEDERFTAISGQDVS
jgi:hypothetical protein